MTDLEIIFRIYEVFRASPVRRTLKTICFRDLTFIGMDENLSDYLMVKKIRTEYWKFVSYYLGDCRKRENHRPNYRDILELKDKTDKYLKRVNNIRQRNWFWKKPILLK